jgi:SAM-dependent methyltransferase
MQFDNLTDVYEAMIDWPKRLSFEGAFFRRVFERIGVKRVADVACGSGRHAAMFHSWGLEVHASDISPNMIERARQTHGEPPGLRWTIQGFDQPPGESGYFDAIVCLGNSLALAPDTATAMHALRQMLLATRPGGLVVVHVVNLWKLTSGPCVWQKIVRSTLPQGPALIIKGIHRCNDQGYVELIVSNTDEQTPAMQSNSVRFLGLRAEQMESIARQSGASEITFYGDHKEQPYDPASSGDLIMLAIKSA